jgi:hypothetical protein
MNLDENITDVFDRFLSGQMNEAEAKEFLQQLDTDPALKEAYDWHRNIVAGIREARREELKDYIKKNANIRYIGNVWSRNWVLTSAAVVTLFFAAYLAIEFYIKPATEKTVAVNGQVDSARVDSNGLNNQEPQIAHNAENDENKGDAKEKDATPQINNNEEVAQGNPPPSPQTVQSTEDATADNKKAVNVYVANKPLRSIDKSQVGKEYTQNTKQFWVYFKPANTYNYQYSKDKLTLYKVKYEENIALYEVEKKTYMGWNSNYYPLKQDGTVHTLEELSDSSVLKALPPLK